MNPTWQVTAAVVDTGSCDLAVKYRKVYLKRTGGVMHIIRTEDDTDPAAAMSRPAVREDWAVCGNLRLKPGCGSRCCFVPRQPPSR